jgi:hypothetical protein
MRIRAARAAVNVLDGKIGETGDADRSE